MASSTTTRNKAAGPQDLETISSAAATSEAQSKNLKLVFVTGGPGSGKGTQCNKIVEHFGFEHLSAGELLRAEQNSDGEIGKMIKGLINEGKLVPSEMTVKLILNAMSKCSNNKILIDGFPRNDENREVWDRVAGLKPEFIIFITSSEEVMQNRLLSRNEGRDDDNLETIRKRFKLFNEQTLPVIKHYESIAAVQKINGMQSVEDVFAEIRPLFNPILQEELLQATADLLTGLDTGNYKAYKRYCHPALSIFEPDSQGQLVEGMDLRKFKFNVGSVTDRLTLTQRLRSTVVTPKVSILGAEVALVSYTRVLKLHSHPDDGDVEAYNETGVWQRLKSDDGCKNWKLVHYHRSVAPTI
ncbi:UMP-CMP kinase 3 isoform X1 [Physcomitrium patens]|uniref:adenylate kinase n=1 Tax=Physcomitrium patens TaxID=3218 RepID=A0A2K1L3X0_PHYPA|nr:UMP-CMP kinase 3-like isoform X1 [Physcomitrium patens]XP_024404069.1 UMP-CMP kinase 3-like isoform X1 [Physcomitrium patens]XP_024404077.1 UMP-CMP kinase 3-like isoform X1 [Physcomitrium patens]XP_024404086.1 UMP-CMP kinase 3-like isoform X1 [Physcomitrium patens]XP_024404097.1 UMP-CMP kinase 3-like isoform X1 [Physcomitrium patens]XP_024404106.1 UMP-CMP kinase 3-like isoform X1 [Physcomitrium patens]XP_024404115.1 UMP-CMP kinase 3-like isoform X1 [Physcomitrium patens]XP_024404126.1 UMP|eukprot:XP_024404059.1 UMP-CMP kinase 3-like isoform X1 [Physcomitrella patens]